MSIFPVSYLDFLAFVFLRSLLPFDLPLFILSFDPLTVTFPVIATSCAAEEFTSLGLPNILSY